MLFHSSSRPRYRLRWIMGLVLSIVAFVMVLAAPLACGPKRKPEEPKPETKEVSDTVGIHGTGEETRYYMYTGSESDPAQLLGERVTLDGQLDLDVRKKDSDLPVRTSQRLPVLLSCNRDKPPPQLYNDRREPVDQDTDGRSIVWCNHKGNMTVVPVGSASPKATAPPVGSAFPGTQEAECPSFTFPVTPDYDCRVQAGTFRESAESWDEYTRSALGVQASLWVLANTTVKVKWSEAQRSEVLTHIHHRELWSFAAQSSDSPATAFRHGDGGSCELKGKFLCVGRVTQVAVGHMSMAVMRHLDKQQQATVGFTVTLPAVPSGYAGWEEKTKVESLANRAIYAGIVGYTIRLTDEGRWAMDGYEMALKFGLQPESDADASTGGTPEEVKKLINDWICSHVGDSGEKDQCTRAVGIGVQQADTKRQLLLGKMAK